MKRTVLLLAVAWLFVVTSVGAQTRTGILTGHITDATGGALPGVVVTATSPALIEGTRTEVTNERGLYRFIDLPPGDYVIRAEVAGFSPFEQAARVNLATTTSINMEMKVGGVSDEVTVTTTSPIIDPESTKIAVNYTGEFLQMLPTSRNLDAIMNMAPGLVDRAALGTGVKENYISLDGTYLTDPGNGQQMIFWNQDIVEEAQVATAGHNAEFGNAPGAVVNAVTRSGGDEMSGLFNYFYRNESMRSDNHEGTGLTAPTSAIEEEWEGAASLGGPVVRKKAWYFANYGYIPTVTTTAGFPDDITRKQQFVFGKLTTQFHPKHRVSLVYNYSSDDTDHMFASQFRTPESTLRSEQWTSTTNLQWNFVATPKLLIEMRAANVDRSTTYVSNSEGPSFFERTTGMLANSAGFGNEQTRNRIQLQPSASYWLGGIGGDHHLKVGLEYEFGDSGYDGRFYNDDRGLYAYTTQDGVPIQASGYVRPHIVSADEFKAIGAYAQDTWKLGRRLTLNLGARFNNVQNVVPVQDFVESPIEFTNFSNVEPRAGAAFDLSQGDRQMAVSAHYGRYYNNSVALGAANPNGHATRTYRIEADGTLTLINQSNPSTTLIDPDLRRPYSESIIVGYRMSLAPSLALRVNGVFKKSRDFIGTIDINRPAELFDPFMITNPLSGESLTVYNLRAGSPASRLYYTNPEGADRDYRALETVLEQRMSHNLQFIFSHVWSRSEGLAAQGQWSGYGGETVGGTWNNPNFFINAGEGLPLDMDRTHQLKLSSVYTAPLDVVVGVNYIGQSGYPYTRSFTTTLNQGSSGFNAEPQGSQRLPFQHLLDVRVEKRFQLKGYQPRVFFEAFNLLNSNDATGIGSLIGSPTYERITAIMPPRTLRVGLGLQF